MRGYIFIKNTLVLTATALILRTIGIVFRVWLAGEIGSEGVGLYQLIFSVYVLAATFATSGICTAVTKMIAEGEQARRPIGQIMRKAGLLTAIAAVISTGIIFFASDFIANLLIGDSRATLALKILSFSLPFMGFSSCLKGYFIARRKTIAPSSSQLFEQVIRIAIIMLLVGKAAPFGIAFTAAAVLIGDTIAEICSCLWLYILFLKDKSNLMNGGIPKKRVGRQIVHIALPISGGRYLTTALHTVENLLVPRKIEGSGISAKAGLSQFGMLKGMALPMVFFPASFLSALATLLVPEISEASAKGNARKVAEVTEKAVGTTLVLSILISSCFIVLSNKIGNLVYGSTEVGFMMLVLAPIIPFMYLESVCDGILKGLDQQLHSFWYNCADLVIRIVLVITIVPHFGMNGFLGIMIVSNISTCTLNSRRLFKVTNVKLKIRSEIILPVIASVAGCFVGTTVAKTITGGDIAYISVELLLHCAVFFSIMLVFRKNSIKAA